MIRSRFLSKEVLCQRRDRSERRWVVSIQFEIQTLNFQTLNALSNRFKRIHGIKRQESRSKPHEYEPEFTWTKSARWIVFGMPFTSSYCVIRFIWKSANLIIKLDYVNDTAVANGNDPMQAIGEKKEQRRSVFSNLIRGNWITISWSANCMKRTKWSSHNLKLKKFFGKNKHEPTRFLRIRLQVFESKFSAEWFRMNSNDYM